MDYDYIEDDRPRFQLASGPALPEDERKLDIRLILVCASVGFLLLGYGWLIGSSFMHFAAYWLGVALIVGPFAPISYTGGDCRVGVGEVLPPEKSIDPLSAESDRRHSGRKRQDSNLTRVQSKESLSAVEESSTQGTVDSGLKYKNAKAVESDSANWVTDFVRDEEWTAAELELLRKHMAKHPRGTARRWEVISDVFQGLHSVESVIKVAKALTERKPADDDSYAKFLSQRKGLKVDIDSPLSQREEADAAMLRAGRLANGVAESERTDDAGRGKPLIWNEESDKALLTALKVFPKDSPMRWDKIAAAVTGKSKAQCFRRYADLRESFRNKKGGTVPNPDAD